MIYIVAVIPWTPEASMRLQDLVVHKIIVDASTPTHAIEEVCPMMHSSGHDQG